MPLVGVIMGSQTDAPLMQGALDTLKDLGIEYEVSVLSAHRTPDAVREYGLNARGRGLEVLIAGAGGSAHLPGVLASWSDLPVIGVPLPTSELKGVDALYSMCQMPSGVPVATVGIGGARNAALLAARILAISHGDVHLALDSHRKRLSRGSKP
ncbi:MAG: 5-(carboxyamino)imidazole ribonucleotide mutase [Chloroflexi bacterium]|nr:5-(carboxyamino)imidazole ribonucleotide mutase [Chloroflexota bacterium]